MHYLAFFWFPVFLRFFFFFLDGSGADVLFLGGSFGGFPPGIFGIC